MHCHCPSKACRTVCFAVIDTLISNVQGCEPRAVSLMYLRNVLLFLSREDTHEDILQLGVGAFNEKYCHLHEPEDIQARAGRMRTFIDDMTYYPKYQARLRRVCPCIENTQDVALLVYTVACRGQARLMKTMVCEYMVGYLCQIKAYVKCDTGYRLKFWFDT